MENSKKTIEYKDHTIKLTPHEDRCSLFAMTISNQKEKR